MRPMRLSFMIALCLSLLAGLHAQTVQYPGLSTPNIFSNSNQFLSGVYLGPQTFSSLPSLVGLSNFVYITDGTNGSNPCTGGGTGAFAMYVGGVWNCGFIGGGIVGTLTPGVIPQAASATTIANSSPQLDNGVTLANTLTYSGAGGLNLPSDGVHAGSLQLGGNTTLPSLFPNAWGFIGPNSSSFTAYYFQPTAIPPAAASAMTVGAPNGSGISSLTYTPFQGTDTSLMTAGTISGGAGTAVCLDGNAGLTAGACPAGSSVSGSGTANTLAMWTNTSVLGNSPLTVSGSNILSSDRLQITSTPSVSTSALYAQATPQSSVTCNGTGSAGFDPTQAGASSCSGAVITLSNYQNNQATSGFTAALLSRWTPSSSGASSAITSAGIVGLSATTGSGSPNWFAGTVGSAQINGTSGTVGTLSGVVGVANIVLTGQVAAIQDGVDGQVSIDGAGQTQAFGAAIYARAARIGASATCTQCGGVYIPNQVATGNTNPFGVYEAGNAPNYFQGHIGQVATGNWAGTCAFASSTTCSISYSSAGVAYTSTPVVILTPVNPGGLTFTLTSSSNTGFTVTASSSTSLTVNWVAIGNPN